MKVPKSYNVPKAQVSDLFTGGADILASAMERSMQYYGRVDFTSSIRHMDYTLMAILQAAADVAKKGKKGTEFDMMEFSAKLRGIGRAVADKRPIEFVR